MQRDRELRHLIERYPLAIVFGVALGLRLLAVIFSKGFMASDDHYQTVRIVCEWLVHGPFGDDGFLTWGEKGAETIARNPLYVLFLYAIMKPLHLLGIESLDCMMYVVRAVHGLISLVGVYAVFRLVQRFTRSNQWGVAAGVLAAAHFLLPFLSVRNLIEMVAANFWMLSLWYLYKDEREDSRSLFLSGLFTGVAWMIRFQIGAAAFAIPFALWWQRRSLRPVWRWLSGAIVVFLFSGAFERYFLGGWWGGTWGHLEQGMREGALYSTSPFIYVVVLIAAFFPPISLLVAYLLCRAKIWKEHLPLLLSSLFFVLLHTVQGNRQERFMTPMLYPLIAVGVLAFWYAAKSGSWWGEKCRLKWVGGYVLTINILLLPLLTFNYGHKGEVEPLVRIQKTAAESVLVYFSPDVRRIFPLDYLRLGSDPPRLRVANWEEYERLIVADSLATGPYSCILYPRDEADLGRYVDSLSKYFSNPKLVDHVDPSTVDLLLHLANPKHNKTHEVWIYRADSLTDFMRKKSDSVYSASQSQVMNSP